MEISDFTLFIITQIVLTLLVLAILLALRLRGLNQRYERFKQSAREALAQARAFKPVETSNTEPVNPPLEGIVPLEHVVALHQYIDTEMEQIQSYYQKYTNENAPVRCVPDIPVNALCAALRYQVLATEKAALPAGVDYKKKWSVALPLLKKIIEALGKPHEETESTSSKTAAQGMPEKNEPQAIDNTVIDLRTKWQKYKPAIDESIKHLVTLSEGAPNATDLLADINKLNQHISMVHHVITDEALQINELKLKIPVNVSDDSWNVSQGQQTSLQASDKTSNDTSQPEKTTQQLITEIQHHLKQ